MKAVLTRVSQATVTVDGQVVGSINCPETCGILALVGVGKDDSDQAWEVMARKIAELRILPGEKSVMEAQAPVLLVSQFTLLGRTAKGRRPSWSDAAHATVAEPVLGKIAQRLAEQGITVEQGKFGAMMEVSSMNSGPVTVIVEC